MTDAFGLRWAIKRRFVAYLKSLPDGAFSVDEGASRADEDVFVFPPRGGATGAVVGLDGLPALPLEFGGVLRLSGHLGMMHVKVAEPVIEQSGDDVVLTISDPDDELPGSRVPFARLVLPSALVRDGVVTWSGVEAFLTSEGSEMFAERYPEGEPLEPLDIRLAVAAA